MSYSIEAIPTLYAGIQFKSRLEARFAEWLDERQFEWEYETKTFGINQYKPDFYVRVAGVYVEVKPKEHGEELEIFRDDIQRSGIPWIAVDSLDRGVWRVWALSLNLGGCLAVIPDKDRPLVLSSVKLPDTPPVLVLRNISGAFLTEDASYMNWVPKGGWQ
jgi:hypothetical protein